MSCNTIRKFYHHPNKKVSSEIILFTQPMFYFADSSFIYKIGTSVLGVTDKRGNGVRQEVGKGPTKKSPVVILLSRLHTFTLTP